MRAARPAAAHALIKQARQRVPDDPAFVQLQAQATLAERRASDGLAIVASAAQPDEPLLLLSPATLYAAAKHGAPVWDETRDRAAFKQWRDAYAAVNGASLTLGDAWQAELTAPK